jgi:hypothetical protein
MAEEETLKDGADEDEIVIIEEDDEKKEGDADSDDSKSEEAEGGSEEKSAEGSEEEEGLDDLVKRRRQLERKNKRLRDKIKKQDLYELSEAMKKENYLLQRRLEAIEKKSQAEDGARLDYTLKSVEAQLQQAMRKVQDAFEAGDGAAHTAAIVELKNLDKQYDEIHAYKKQQSQPRQQNGGTDPLLKRNLEGWMGRNGWYDPTLKDRDSKIARVIDTEMAEEGFDYRDPETWKELDRRLADALPHRYKRKAADSDDDYDDDGEEQPQRRQPKQITGGGRGGEQSSSGKIEVKLSKERIQAIKDLGAWDDPALRREHVKNFLRWDKENAQSKR